MGTVAIVDYGVGNLKSVANALSYLGCSSCITADPAELERAPGRNRGRAGSGAGNNSAGICAFYRRNFVSLSGS
mgnify:CR=1 FL=1